ncbi:MAG: dTDP-4-dehydrorhamnose reductase RmlD [Idiomarinaceae bacterium HL-53]|nr:MAG: dTDP-4-dehydrorhamnose reductase RmlD [Idiomarinaceae bacterium HL-53]CUS47082.1 dTDP-4-dehydrorhamnose reductase [Idiomarinaceae bacterium HL-53]
MRSTILVTGASGQVGFELVRAFHFFGKVIAPERSELNLANESEVHAYLLKHQPNIILNAAAYTAVDRAEDEETECFALNDKLPELLSEFVLSRSQSGISCTLIHFSTDYVYPGTGTKAWKESDAIGPLSVYGKSKLAGEQKVLKNLSSSSVKHYILRTSWVYSARGNNFMKTMLRLALERDSLNIVNDQIGAPTPARLLAQLSVLLVIKDADSGIYHAAPRGETSWFEFAKAIFEQAKSRLSFMIDESGICGIPTENYPTPAVRPLNSRLNLEKVERVLDIELPHWKDELELTLDEYLEQVSGSTKHGL